MPRTEKSVANIVKYCLARLNGTEDEAIAYIEEFFTHIVQRGECWDWREATPQNHGYYKNVRASLVSWLIHKQKWVGELYVCHKCDNPKCVNPEHLFLGTNQENIQDASQKGRLHHPKKALSPEQIGQVRVLYGIAGFTERKLAEIFKVSRMAIRKALKRNVRGVYNDTCEAEGIRERVDLT